MADVIKTATREAYGKALVELGEKDESLIVMDADLAPQQKQACLKRHSRRDFLMQESPNVIW